MIVWWSLEKVGELKLLSMAESHDNVKMRTGLLADKRLDKRENFLYTPCVKHHSFSETAVLLILSWVCITPRVGCS